MINHLGRLIAGLLILTAVYLFSHWLFINWKEKLFWVIFLSVSYVIGLGLESFTNRKKKRRRL
jgi:hypothetical protein